MIPEDHNNITKYSEEVRGDVLQPPKVNKV